MRRLEAPDRLGSRAIADLPPVRQTSPIWNLGDIEVSIFPTFLHQSYANIPAESRMVWQSLWIALAVAQIAG